MYKVKEGIILTVSSRSDHRLEPSKLKNQRLKKFQVHRQMVHRLI